jgi:hypothetical protein
LDIDTLADDLLGSERGNNLVYGGSYTREFLDIYRDMRSSNYDKNSSTEDGIYEELSPLIATIFWRNFISSTGYHRELSRADSSPFALTLGEPIVVSHADRTRYDLLVFDPQFKGEEPKVIQSIKVNIDDFKNLKPFNNRVEPYYGLFRSPNNIPYSRRLINDLIYNMINETIDIQNFGLIIAPTPKYLFTSSIPSKSIKVECPAGKFNATVGITGRDSENRLGVTTALHSIKDSSEILINGVKGVIVSADVITDSCFIEISPVPIPIHNIGFRGPLKGVTPRVNEDVHFQSMNRGEINTIIIGWTPDVPFHFPGSQLKVYTKAVTQQGDSGTALIDTNEHVIGFCFYRTGFNAKIEFSAWIWAESVFDVHSLNLSGFAK